MIDRREMLKCGLGASLALCPTRWLSAQESPTTLRPRPGDLLVRSDDAAMKPLAAEDIPLVSAPLLAWAMDPSDRTVRSGSRLNRLLLLRFDEAQLTGDTKSRAAAGVVAYTVICTHTGCDVSEWLPDEQVLHCPCHFSKYDPKNGAAVVDGPAPRPLPALPLTIADGRLAVAAPFSARVSFDPA
jgi:nitrite reductase/ring-hydroxylating ferredoxin subunit